MPAPTDLELAIFRTLCWFSVFEMPLTRFEIWKWLLVPSRAYDLLEVDQTLSTSTWLSHRLCETQGMYTLNTAPISVYLQERHRRFLDASRKFYKLRRACAFFRTLPGVEAVAAANTLSWWHTTQQSDIDLYIITKPNRIWSSRFFLVLPFLIMGHRPHHAHDTPIRDPFCFSFFSTTNALQLETYKWNARDYYLAYWVKSLVPMFDRSNILTHVSTLNKWTDGMLPNARPRIEHPVHRSFRLPKLPIQWSMFEPVFRSLQRNRFPRILRELANKDTRVVITDETLKFHENDRREQFLQRFEDAYQRHL